MSGTDLPALRTIIERHALVCAVCLYIPDGRKAKTALTVIGGYAVCEDHLDYVDHGQHWSSTLEAAKREAAR